MNVYKKSDKMLNKHEQIDFEGVEEELCLIVSQSLNYFMEMNRYFFILFGLIYCLNSSPTLVT